MRGLFSAVLVLIVSMSLIFGVSPALAQSEDDAEVLVVSIELMEELDGLVKKLEQAEQADNQEMIQTLKGKIQVLKEDIRKAGANTPVETGEPRIIKQPGSPDLVKEAEVIVKEPTVVPRDITAVETTSSRIDPCAEAKALEEKKQYYEALYALSDEELKGKGYSRGKEEIKITIGNLEKSIERLRAECENGTPGSAGGGSGVGTVSPTETVPVEVVALEPIAVRSGGEITDYYRLRIAEIVTKEVEIEEQIGSLKELRNEIDKLIEDLIKSKAEISTDEVSGLVEIIEVSPGEVKMDKVVVKTVDKDIIVSLDDKELAIKPTEDQVIIHDGNLEVKAPELSIENEILKVGGSDVKLMPSVVIEQIKIEPIEIELKEENGKAVYKIQAEETRKLLGFIPVKIEKALTVGAEDKEVKISDEDNPWWTFLTTR